MRIQPAFHVLCTCFVLLNFTDFVQVTHLQQGIECCLSIPVDRRAAVALPPFAYNKQLPFSAVSILLNKEALCTCSE